MNKKQSGKQKAFHDGFNDGLNNTINQDYNNPERHSTPFYAGKPHCISYAKGFLAGKKERIRLNERTILQKFRNSFVMCVDK